MNTEIIAMTHSARMSRRVPSRCRQPRQKIGILMRIDSTPTGMRVSRWMICAMPVTPPETMLFGNVKN